MSNFEVKPGIQHSKFSIQDSTFSWEWCFLKSASESQIIAATLPGPHSPRTYGTPSFHFSEQGLKPLPGVWQKYGV
ncbi:MAG: hypothetical protein WC708_05640 [Lentisphaeria bacterium]